MIKTTCHICLTVGGATTGHVATFNIELVEAARNGSCLQEVRY